MTTGGCGRPRSGSGCTDEQGGERGRGLVSQAVLNGVTLVTPEAARKAVGPVSAPALMRAHPRLIRRPVIEFGGRALIGFDEAARAALAGPRG